VGLTATALVVTGWTSTGAIAAGAAEDPLPGVPQLRSLEDVTELAASTQSDDGVRVAVLSDVNGSTAGGIGVTALMADPAQVGTLTDELAAVPGVISAAVDTRLALAEDPYASQQYAPGRVRADLVPEVATGDGVLVAVIDSGVQGTHPDLTPLLPGGRPRVLPGTTFLTPDPGKPNLTGSPGNVDPNGHGTHVAGIIAAARGNGLGVEGIAPDAQILPVRALDPKGFGWSSDVAAAILWAHQQGADVINLSLAGPEEPQAVSDAIDWVATDPSRSQRPTVVVAAAGNSGTVYPRIWPAAHPRVIAVASSDSVDGIASTSSRGTYVDVAAPGVNVLSTCTTSVYCFRSGTSMASPLVAGVAALLREQDPRRAGWSVETVLEATATDIDAPGTDTASGAGRVDVAAALAPGSFPKVPRNPRLPTGTITSVTAEGRTIVVRGTARDPDGAPLVHIESLAMVDGRRSVRDIPVGGGNYVVGWSGTVGTHVVCISAVDAPTRQPVPLGCRDVVVK
jgi:subtilisin family serine protease